MADPETNSGSATADPHAGDRPTTYGEPRNWLVTLPTAALLLLAIVFGTSAFIHGQLLSLGGHIWQNYSLLRTDMARPDCNPNPDIAAQVKKAQQAKADKDSLFDTGPADPKALRKSLTAQRDQCRQSLKVYHYNHKMTATASLRVFRTLELGMGQVNDLGGTWQPYILVLLIMFGGFIALALTEQIALRPAHSTLDHRVAAAAQLATHLALTISALAWLHLDSGGDLVLDGLWAAGFAVLGLLSAYRLIRVPAGATGERSLFQALLVVPLYCWLALVSIIYFFGIEHYLAGPVIQLTKMIRFADMYTSIGLYVWVGMMLKHTRLAALVFDLFRSWEMRPEFVVIIVVLISAFPTAYTGASGIFVLAIGAVIYQELRIAGAYRQLSIASTAMSGSMGVVLNPCLMIVIIAALNRQVTTDQLYGWGHYVFILSALLFCGFIYLTRKTRPHLATPDHALPKTLRAIVPLVPYLLIAAAVVFAYSYLLGQNFDEFSAPVILPLMLIALLAYDRSRARRLHDDARPHIESREAETPSERPAGFANALRSATAETSTLAGTLLVLMTMSIVFGGVVGRSGVMAVFPEHLGNIWAATAILVVILIVIGMIMDPYGAIILVSATIAPVAYHNGINPVHFWMIVLVAFELGYLSPPVALNQLLTRQVVGEAEYAAAHAEVADDPSFWRRHEILLLPMAVMASSLLLVAFAPLVFNAMF